MRRIALGVPMPRSFTASRGRDKPAINYGSIFEVSQAQSQAKMFYV
jgi:hypothetical protein